MLFTAGHRTSQRVESVHSSIKGQGNKSVKKFLRKMDIYMFLRHVLENEGRKSTESQKQIQTLLGKGESVSEFVKQKLLQELQEGSKITRAVSLNEDMTRFTVVDSNSYNVDLMKPSCTCHYFLNMKLPCRHMLKPSLLNGEVQVSFEGAKDVPSR